MRMLMIFTAGAALMSAPAFAQVQGGQSPYTYPSSPSDQPTSSAQAQNSNEQPQNMTPGDTTGQPGVVEPGAATAPPPSQTQAMPPQPQPEQQPVQGATTPQPQPQTGPGSRMYTAQNGDVQVISNAPVPDTPANRQRFRPLSRAGRETRPRGN